MRIRFYRSQDFFRRSSDPSGDREHRMEAYRAYLSEMESLLPRSLNEFAAKAALHDEGINQVSWTGERQLELRMTCGKVVFTGVQQTDIDWRAINQTILAHEVQPGKNGAADVVLLTAEREFFVTASGVNWS